MQLLVCYKTHQFIQIWLGGKSNEQKSQNQRKGVEHMSANKQSALTWTGRLDLCLVLFCVRVEEVQGWVFTALDLALKGIQTQNVLLLKGAGSTARCAHIQIGGQLSPLLVLVHLRNERGKKKKKELVRITRCLFQVEMFTSKPAGLPGWGHRCL